MLACIPGGGGRVCIPGGLVTRWLGSYHGSCSGGGSPSSMEVSRGRQRPALHSQDRLLVETSCSELQTSLRQVIPTQTIVKAIAVICTSVSSSYEETE